MPHSPPPFAAAAEAGPQEAEHCSINSLPDGLLGRIMALVDREHWEDVMLVCHRWHDVFFAEPGLWRSFRASNCGVRGSAEQSVLLEQQAALLRRIAPHIMCLTWEQSDYGVPAREALVPSLAALPPGRLAELELWGFKQDVLVAVVPQLQRLTGVTSLELGCKGGKAADAALAALSSPTGCLAALGSRLRSLRLSIGYEDMVSAMRATQPPGLSPAALAGIVQLAQLTALGLSAGRWPPMGSLTRLSQLKQLVLASNSYPPLQIPEIPEPASFPGGLEHFMLRSRDLQIGGCLLSQCDLWQGPTAHANALVDDDNLPANLPLPTLSLGTGRVPSLARLLSALQPAGMEPLAFRRLELHGKLPTPAALAGCTQLQQLAELSLENYSEAEAGTFLQAVGAALQQASRLSSLTTNNFGSIARTSLAMLDSTLPDDLLTYRGLSSLTLAQQGVSNLPPGQSNDLRCLELQRNHFTRLPPAISTATALTRLIIVKNDALVLGEADMDTLLALPCLRRLESDRLQAADPALLQQLQLRMPHLRIVPVSRW